MVIAAKKGTEEFARLFGVERYQPLRWCQAGLAQCRSFARIVANGDNVGAGCLVRASGFIPWRAEGEVLLLTSADFWGDDISVVIDTLGKTLSIADVVWGSKNAALLEISDSRGLIPLSLDPPPAPFDPHKWQRVYVLSYGKEQSVSLKECAWVAADGSTLSYRTPSEVPPIGSPIFDQNNWTLMGIQARHRPDGLSTAITVQSIRDECRAPEG